MTRTSRSASARFAVLLALALPVAGCDELISFGALWGFGSPPPEPGRTDPHQVPAWIPSPEPPPARVPRDDETRAWAQLDAGHDAAALVLFERAMGKRPLAVRPVAGYALATALNGDLVAGARAMRWALRCDPAVLRDIRPDDDLSDRLDRLARRYHHRIARGDLEHDTLVMVGAIYFVIEDLDSAASALRSGHRYGDRTLAICNLQHLVAKTIDERPGTLAAEPAITAAPVDAAPRREPDAAASEPGPAPPPRTIPFSEPLAVPPTTTTTTPTTTAAPPNETRPTPPSAPPLPGEPIDYEDLRSDMLEVSETLDRFTRKLLEAIDG